MLDLLSKRITEQQGQKGTAVYMVGEQLKDICRAGGSEVCDMVLKDLENPEMTLAKCEEEIQAFADELYKKLKGNKVCVPPDEAERIIKEFYGISDVANSQTPAKVDTNSGFLDLADFL